jgi:hypothetical protein
MAATKKHSAINSRHKLLKVYGVSKQMLVQNVLDVTFLIEFHAIFISFSIFNFTTILTPVRYA